MQFPLISRRTEHRPVEHLQARIIQDTRKSSVQSQKLQAKPDEQLLLVAKIPEFYAGMLIRAELLNFKGFDIVCEKNSGYAEEINRIFQKSHLDELLISTSANLDIFGKCAWEKLPFIEGEKKGELSRVVQFPDMTKVDYQRTSMRDILVDEYGEPLGIELKRTSTEKEKKLPMRDIVWFLTNPLGGYEPWSLASILYPTSTYLENVFNGLAQAIYRMGFPLLDASIGDAQHEPTQTDLNNAERNYAGMVTSESGVAHPYWDKITFQSPQGSTNLSNSLDRLLLRVCTVMKIPKPFLLGTGEDANRAVAKAQRDYMMDVMSARQRYFKRVLENQIIAPIAESKGWEEIPKVQFRKLSEEDMTEAVNRFAVLYQMQAVTVGEIRKAMGMPEMTPEQEASIGQPAAEQMKFEVRKALLHKLSRSEE